MAPTRLPPRWKFFVDRSDDETLRSEWLLTESEHTLSRAAGLGDPAHWLVAPDERDVSRPHATFAAEGGRAIVIDCGSRYGTFVNGVRVEACARMTLDVGDVVRVGSLLLTLAPAEATSKPPRKAVMARNGTPLRPDFLRVTRGPLTGTKLRLDLGPIFVGSDRWAAVRVTSAHYQGTRVAIESMGGGRHRVVDRSSPQRLRINGEPTTEHVLEHLDELEIGDFLAMTYIVYSKSAVFSALVASTAGSV
jgi:pSer/pThr/pTyr-binding forkhead associated (FHA) protein